MDGSTVVLALVKGIGLLIAGIFGIVGSVTNFKDSHGKLTVWGRRNLIALICGLMISLTAQGIEYVRGRNEATAAARRAQAAAEESERLLELSRKAAEGIATVAQQATAAANKLNEVGANVERGLDPLGPLEVHFSLLISLAAGPQTAIDGAEAIALRQLADFRTRLDGVHLAVNPDDESPPSIRLCLSCPLFPPKRELLAYRLLTESYEINFGFLERGPDGKYPRPQEAESKFGFWVSGASEVGESADGNEPAPYYVPKSQLLHLSFDRRVVGPKDFYAPRGVQSVRDLLGTRMAIQLRPFSDGWLPRAVRQLIRPSLIQWDLSGNRELQFTERNLSRVDGGGEIYWTYDFPRTMEELQRKFVP